MRLGRAAALACMLSVLPLAALAQGKVAVLDIERAIFNTEEAKAQLNALQQTPDFQKNRKEAEELKKKYDAAAEQFNKNREVMSAEQAAEQQKKIQELGTDLQFVAKKLQQAQAEVAQRVMREMTPRAREAIGEVVKTDGIGLLLNAQAAMHADAGYDISAKVTDKLNQMKK
jgi:outer membrane protein